MASRRFFHLSLISFFTTSTCALTACPQADTGYTSPDGTQFKICTGTDLQGPSAQVLDKFPSNIACAARCDSDSTCIRAVYDTQTGSCHFKSNTAALNWATDTRFDVIRKSVCPTSETAYTGANGAKYAICANSDLQGASSQIIPNIASTAACAARCDSDGTCIRAVYDTQTGNCHIKDNNAIFNWVSDTRFVVIRNNNDLPEGTVISKCPFTTSSYTSPGGTKYQICPDTDYRGASAQMINGVATQQACAQKCGTTNGCTKAVYDTVNQVCHIKDVTNDNALIWALNKQFDVIQVINTYNPATQGSWSDFIRLPLIPVAAYIVPASPAPQRLLAFSSWGDFTFGGASGYTQFTDYNFNTGVVSQRTVTNTGHDMFCPGISSLADGRLLITGGSDADVTSIYDPTTNAFTRGPNMQIPRGYQTSCTLSNGRVFTIGGSYSGPRGGKNGEVYDPVANTFTLLPGADVTPMLTTDAEGDWRTDNHGWLFGWKNGSVFQAGPSPKQNWYGTAGSGSVTAAGVRPGADDQMCGVNVMYDVGKILTTGGSTDYTNSPATAMAHITTIGDPGSPSSVERIADMAWPRGFANGVVLPDGTVLVTGGQKVSLVFTDTAGIMTPELFNPATKKWTKMAPESVPRNYHSASLLLPDGRVWSGGGGMCPTGPPGSSDAGCDTTVDHPDGQIFSPPYLFTSAGAAATRPVISSVSNTTPKVGSTITVTMGDTNTVTFALLRIGSATHSINSDQRRIPVTASKNGSKYTIALPSDSGVLIPGNYYLFALSSAGVPAIANTVRVTL